MTTADAQLGRYSLNAYHSASLLYLDYRSLDSFSFLRDLTFSRQDTRAMTQPMYVPFSVGGGLLPDAAFEPEISNDPSHILTEEESDRFERGRSSGSITLPHWLILILYLPFWLGVSFWYWRRSSRVRRDLALPQ